MKWGYAKGSVKDKIHTRELTGDLVEEMLSNHDSVLPGSKGKNDCSK
jgi:hypothetical protein